jgi:ribosome biogenesis GTPase
VVLINKIDCLTAPLSGVDSGIVDQEKILFEEFLDAWSQLNITVIPISTKSGEGIGKLKAAMVGKASVFSGQSGVGKSSLINLVTGSSLATGSIVQRTSKGSHTTSTTHLIPLEEGGFCIDTPGIKSFGLWDLQPGEVATWFPEIFAHGAECKYPDCAHLDEPGCAVKKAALEKEISPLRFASYCALISSLSQEHQKR